MKHAFLILAHNSINNLKNLLLSINFKDCDVFIHIDSKWKDFDVKEILALNLSCKVIVLDKRLNVKWGGVSLIKAKMLLFEVAVKNDYNYYHLISGQDICIKTEKQFCEFFSNHNGKNFISYSNEEWQRNSKIRYNYYHIDFGRGKFINKILHLIDKVSVRFQKIFRIDRSKRSNFKTIKGGSEWCSLTNEAVKLILSKEADISNTFGHSHCCDELYKHTVIYNDEIFNSVVNDDLRFIDWTRGKPYTFTEEDFYAIIRSDALFARKIDANNRLPIMILDFLYNNSSSLPGVDNV